MTRTDRNRRHTRRAAAEAEPLRWLRGVLRPFGLLRENLKSLIAFEVIFRLLAFLVLFPILTWAQRLWLIGNRTKVIAWYNAKNFFMNPVTWIVFVLMILLLAAAALFEQFAVYDMLHASNFGIRRTTRQIFSAGFDMCVERARLENWGFVPYVYLVLHFGTILDISSITSVLHLPGFILEDFSKHTWEMVAYNAMQIVATYFFLRWIFAIPIMMEEDGTSFSKACRKSSRMTRGWYLGKILLLTIFWITCGYIDQNDFYSYCDITSQDYATLEEVREIDPNVLTAYTSVIGIGDIETLDAADIISINETFATYENIERIHHAGKVRVMRRS